MTLSNSFKKKLPMHLTNFRMVLVPVVGYLMFLNTFEASFWAVVFFIIASVTDYYDGYFARKFNATSNLGKFMDPVADKILVTSVLVFLLLLKKVDVSMVLIIMARDTIIGGVRAAAAADRIVIDAKSAGKTKTALQMIALPLMMITPYWDFMVYFEKLGYYAMWISVALSVISGYQYVMIFLKKPKT